MILVLFGCNFCFSQLLEKCKIDRKQNESALSSNHRMELKWEPHPIPATIRNSLLNLTDSYSDLIWICQKQCRTSNSSLPVIRGWGKIPLWNWIALAGSQFKIKVRHHQLENRENNRTVNHWSDLEWHSPGNSGGAMSPFKEGDDTANCWERFTAMAMSCNIALAWLQNRYLSQEATAWPDQDLVLAKRFHVPFPHSSQHEQAWKGGCQLQDGPSGERANKGGGRGSVNIS